LDYCFHCAEDISNYKDQGVFCPECGKQFAVHCPQSHELPPGTFLNNNRYFVGKSLGEGGFGITYIGFDTKLKRKVVIKETFYSGIFHRNCNDNTISDPLKVTYDNSINIRKIREKAEKEFHSLAKAESLRNILKVYDWFNENNTSYIIVEYIKGNTLYDRINKKGRYTWEELYPHIRPLMQSLSQLHRQNVLHRDIKPKNIMIRQSDNNEEFVLIDFGLARTNESTALTTHTNCYSPGYSPFEQRSNSKNDGTYTDVYSIAATIYSALTGEEPTTVIYEKVDENFPKLEALRNSDDIPNHVVDALRYALNPDYRKRCQTIEKLISCFDNTSAKKTERKTISISNTPNNSGNNDGKTVIPKKYLSSIIASSVILLALLSTIIALTMGKNVTVPHSVEKNEKIDTTSDYNKNVNLEITHSIEDIDTAIDSYSIVNPEETSYNISSQLIEEENTSSKTEFATIPDVKGLSLDTAKKMIESAGFKYITVEEENNSVDNNHILSQSPAAGDKAERGSSVNLVVSKKKKKAKTDNAVSSEPTTIEVPDVTNQSYEDAVKNLAERGLTADIEFQHNDIVEPNHVISQSPSNGSVNPQSRITLVISKGADNSVFEVDNYVGQNIENVKAYLEENDINAVYSYVDMPNSMGNILSQNITPGNTIPKGSTITFTVSQKAYEYNTGIYFRSLTCSSQMDGFGKDNLLYFTGGNAWAPNKSGGIGEYVYFDVTSTGKPVTVYGFIIDIGVTANSEEFYNNGRATGLRFEFSDHSFYEVNLLDVMTHQVFYLDHSVDTTYLKIIITDSTSGNLRNNSCIGTIVPLI